MRWAWGVGVNEKEGGRYGGITEEGGGGGRKVLPKKMEAGNIRQKGLTEGKETRISVRSLTEGERDREYPAEVSLKGKETGISGRSLTEHSEGDRNIKSGEMSPRTWRRQELQAESSQRRGRRTGTRKVSSFAGSGLNTGGEECHL